MTLEAPPPPADAGPAEAPPAGIPDGTATIPGASATTTGDTSTAPGGNAVARAIDVEGVVQGVGFRPFVYRLARELGLDGTVRNVAGRVEVDAFGAPGQLDAFARRLGTDAPPRSRVERVLVGDRAPGAVVPGSGFGIDESVAAPSAVRLFPPDIATCEDCLRELDDPADRRYRYPFINCTNCGPRATIIEDLPYDRAKTSMRDFPLCAPCQREYRDPDDRRFHAEPVACPACGPALWYRRPDDAGPVARREDALALAASDLLAGRIVAVKGLGGYHLACDATDGGAVERLRDRKRRWAKPFAVMVPDLDAARVLARVSAEEAGLLASPARPIVLLELRPDAHVRLADGVTAGDRRVGLFMPYTPLHHLLLAAVGRPIVLTSGNLSDEPLVTDDAEALERLAAIADAFLGHDRRIRARYDDSVTRVVPVVGESIIRRGRGYAPDPLRLPVALPDGLSLLAAGAELKHTFTLAGADRAWVSPHTGDLEDLRTYRAFEENLAHLAHLLALEPTWVAHDLHPGYLSTQAAVRAFPIERRLAIQHHHAHVASCAAEHGVTRSFMGIAYDGLGMGDDGTFWGGEILLATLRDYRRVARFGRAPMPGGALAVRRPYRMALGYLLGLEALAGPGGSAVRRGDVRAAGRTDGGAAGRGERRAVGRLAEALSDGLAASFLGRLDEREVAIVRTQLARGINAPVASSAGRLFDAVSSLLGIRDVAEYEAQAAIELERAADPTVLDPLPHRIVEHEGLLVYDPAPTLLALLEGAASGEPTGVLAARFQRAIVSLTRELCGELRTRTGIGIACLSGGVFQNAMVTASLLEGLAADGFEVHMNHAVPVNDGGISYGQAAIAAARLETRAEANDREER